ncbi:MAG: hypothetical protein ACPG19_03925 [Saprospiraceae bacterium]
MKTKAIFIIIFSIQGFSAFAQFSALEKEALDLINPVYAKVISDMDTIFILKNQVRELKPYLEKLELLSVDTIRIDSTIVYEEQYNRRTFSTEPIYGEMSRINVLSKEKIVERGQSAEYGRVTEIVKVKDATTRWVVRKCKGPNFGIAGNPDDCQNWVLVEVPARYEEVTKTILTNKPTSKLVKIPAEYGRITKRFIKQKPQILKTESLNLKYRSDTIMIQTKWKVERTINTPAQYTWTLDTIWIPEAKQKLSLVMQADYKIVDEMVVIGLPMTRWFRIPIVGCSGGWAMEEIPAKTMTIQKVIACLPTHWGNPENIKSKKIRYRIIPRKTLKTPASTTIEHFPSVFEPKITQVALNAREHCKETLHIQATELIYIYKKK